MDDFPKATPPPKPASTEAKADLAPKEPAKELTPEEKQLLACKKVISKLTAKCCYGCVNFTQPLFPSVLNKLEENGFEVTYTDTYGTGLGHTVRVTIVDPGLRQAFATQVTKKATDMFAGSGASQELQDGLNTLMDAFLGGGSNVTSFRF